jgi:hypothetical protein
MTPSEKHSVKNRLLKIHNQINELIIDIEKVPKNRERIKKKYSALKTQLKSDFDFFETAKRRSTATEDEANFYYPAAMEAYIELTVRANSPPNQNMLGCLFSVQDIIEFYLDQLNE